VPLGLFRTAMLSGERRNSCLLDANSKGIAILCSKANGIFSRNRMSDKRNTGHQPCAVMNIGDETSAIATAKGCFEKSFHELVPEYIGRCWQVHYEFRSAGTCTYPAQ
jgi:hypothetical protein